MALQVCGTVVMGTLSAPAPSEVWAWLCTECAGRLLSPAMPPCRHALAAACGNAPNKFVVSLLRCTPAGAHPAMVGGAGSGVGAGEGPGGGNAEQTTEVWVRVGRCGRWQG